MLQSSEKSNGTCTTSTPPERPTKLRGRLCPHPQWRGASTFQRVANTLKWRYRTERDQANTSRRMQNSARSHRSSSYDPARMSTRYKLQATLLESPRRSPVELSLPRGRPGLCILNASRPLGVGRGGRGHKALWLCECVG